MINTEPRFVPGADSMADLEAKAKRVLPADVYDYVAGGAGDERTMAANLAGFGRYRLRPRVLHDVSTVDTSTVILGTVLGAPILGCPTGSMARIHPDGEGGKARGLAAAGVGTIVPLGCNVTLEEVAAKAGPARWINLYWHRDREITLDLVGRAERAEYKAVCLTVDTAMPGNRRRNVRNGFRQSPEDLFANLMQYGERALAQGPQGASLLNARDSSIGWKDVEWLKAHTRLPIVVKGIMTAEDARSAIGSGVDGVMVSNHGGRQLDGLPGTIEVLEEIVDAVAGKAVVLVDGGFRRSIDILTALALGASAVGLGRPFVWAMACGGEKTVRDVATDLVMDLQRSMALLGVASISSLDRSHISRAGQYLPDHPDHRPG